ELALADNWRGSVTTADSNPSATLRTAPWLSACGGALPHLQVGLGAAGQVVNNLRPGDMFQILDPVQEQSVVRRACQIEIPGSSNPLTLVDRGAVVKTH